MLGLITDRGQANVDRRNALAAKGWNGMTDAERAEWEGDILSPTLANYNGAVNLLPNNNYYSGAVNLDFRNKSITAKAQSGGVYLYAVVIVGDAEKYKNKTMILSVDSVESFGGATPLLVPYWHDENGYEAIPYGDPNSALGNFVLGSSALAGSPGNSIVFNTGENAGGRAYLAIYVYVTTDTAVEAGAYVRYNGLMLEMGSDRHDYVPYTEALPTEVRKGGYNYSDLNRVERAVGEIAHEMGLNLTVKTDWKAWDVPTQSDMDRFLGNVQLVRQWGTCFSTTPQAPENMSKLTYTLANDIEKILFDIDQIIASIFHLGELYCGEV